MKSEELQTKAKQILESEGRSVQELSNQEKLEQFIIPGLQNSQNTLDAIYFSSRERQGLLGTIKSKIQTKIINTVINVVEKQSMKQQKFNTMTYKAIEKLVEENKELNKQIEEVKQGG